MYEFVTGPLAWLAFGIFFIGLIVRTVLYIKGLDWKLDRVTYSVNTSYGVRGAARSILFWLFPYGTHSWRNNPWFTLWVFVMHIGLLLTPIFLLGHNILLKESWGVGWWTQPEDRAKLHGEQHRERQADQEVCDAEERQERTAAFRERVEREKTRPETGERRKRLNEDQS